MRKTLGIVFGVALIMLCSNWAYAQEGGPRIGLVTGLSAKHLTEVATARDKVGARRIYPAGTPCLLRPGDLVTFVVEVANTDPPTVMVTRRFDSKPHYGMPNFRVCNRGEDVMVSREIFEQWEKAYRDLKVKQRDAKANKKSRL